jgi:hypothetical protein
VSSPSLVIPHSDRAVKDEFHALQWPREIASAESYEFHIDGNFPQKAQGFGVCFHEQENLISAFTSGPEFFRGRVIGSPNPRNI